MNLNQKCGTPDERRGLVSDRRTNSNLLCAALTACLLIPLSACVVHHYDKETGVDRLFGFGYIKTRVSGVNEGLQLQARQVRVIGLGIDSGEEAYGVAVGYNEQTRVNIFTNMAIRLEWSYRDLFGVRAGTNFQKMDSQPTLGTKGTE